MTSTSRSNESNEGKLVFSIMFIVIMTYCSYQATSFTLITTRPFHAPPSPFSASPPAKTKTTLSASNDKTKAEKPTNEFSRPIRTEIILSPRSSKRQYNTDISATPSELSKLAERFSLSKITKLDATLSLTKDSTRSPSAASRSSTNGGECIIVEGNVSSKVTQTCVRTNEDFDVDLDFSIYSIVRAVDLREVRQRREERMRGTSSGGGELGGMSLSQIEDQLGGGGGGGGYRKKDKRKKRGIRGGSNSNNNGGVLNDFNMKEIENLLQEFDTEDDIFEDENVMGSDGMLDVGELVSQMFRLKLDPYPKKPGSEPVSYSISG